MAAEHALPRHRPPLGPSLAEHADLRYGGRLSGPGAAGRDERVGGARDDASVRDLRRAVDRPREDPPTLRAPPAARARSARPRLRADVPQVGRPALPPARRRPPLGEEMRARRRGGAVSPPVLALPRIADEIEELEVPERRGPDQLRARHPHRHDLPAAAVREAPADGPPVPRHAREVPTLPARARATPAAALLDEPEVEGYLPRENQPPMVTHPRDGGAGQHSPRGHRDDLVTHPAHQDESLVSDDFHAVELHPSRTIGHDPALGPARGTGGRHARSSVVRAWEPCAP